MSITSSLLRRERAPAPPPPPSFARSSPSTYRLIVKSRLPHLQGISSGISSLGRLHQPSASLSMLREGPSFYRHPLPSPVDPIPNTRFWSDYATRRWQFHGSIEGIGPQVA